MQLWRKFLDRMCIPSQVPASSDTSIFRRLETVEIEYLAAWELNGREIKNAVKTARNWCISKGHQLSVDKMESAIAVTAPMVKKTAEELRVTE